MDEAFASADFQQFAKASTRPPSPLLKQAKSIDSDVRPIQRQDCSQHSDDKTFKIFLDESKRADIIDAVI